MEQYRKGDLSKVFGDDSMLSPRAFFVPSGNTSDEETKRLEKEVVNYETEYLLVQRNKRMAARIVELLVNKPDKYFFAVGAGHLVGDDSIVDFIRRAGFSVKHLQPKESLNFR